MNAVSTMTILQEPREQHTLVCDGSDFDTAAAHREGWTVSGAEQNTDCTPGVQLQRLDDPECGDPQFPDDRDVWKHVVTLARAGSALHRQALALVDPFERCLIEATCGPV